MTPLWRLPLSKEARAWGHYLLFRQPDDNPAERAFYVVFAPRTGVTLDSLVRIAGQRWQIEQGFQIAKGECGLDQYEVHRWTGGIGLSRLPCWSMPCSLSCVRRPVKKTPHERIGLTLGEIRRWLIRFMWRGKETASHWLRWSDWRRRHRYRAWLHHKRRQQYAEVSEQLRL